MHLPTTACPHSPITGSPPTEGTVTLLVESKHSPQTQYIVVIRWMAAAAITQLHSVSPGVVLTAVTASLKRSQTNADRLRVSSFHWC
eukprot:3140052-Rhodomonas_salina.1